VEQKFEKKQRNKNNAVTDKNPAHGAFCLINDSIGLACLWTENSISNYSNGSKLMLHFVSDGPEKLLLSLLVGKLAC